MFSTLPNQLSLLRILLSPVFFALFIAENPVLRLLSIGVYLLAALTDWYDGEIARRRNAITNVGKFLDPLADKFLTSAAFIAFTWLGHVAAWMVAVIIIRDLVITVLRSLAEIRNAHIVTSKSAQTKTFVQMAVQYYLMLMILLAELPWFSNTAQVISGSVLHPTLIFILMLIVTLFTLGTGVQYLYDNRRFLLDVLGTRHRAIE
jgi:CDP-diacylglycerol---glycerol-3-phosphate 3-phosphatidyltransferase